MASVGIEAAVRPICGKYKARADNIFFPLLLFLLIMVVIGKRYSRIATHESRTQIIRSGTVVGHHGIMHHYARNQFTEKVSAQLIHSLE